MSPYLKMTTKKLVKKQWYVHLVREYDDNTYFEVEAETAKKAEKIALRQARDDPERYFSNKEPAIAIDIMMETEEVLD